MKKKVASTASRKTATGPTAGAAADASRQIDEIVALLGDWRGATLTAVRGLIHEAIPDVLEEIKWVKPSNPLGVPVWSCAGIICTGETYKQVVKLTFARGAALDDPRHLFNASLEGNARRAIDIREGEMPAAGAFKNLIKAAAAENKRVAAAKKVR